ncbi:hypothetical protein DM860_015387 [Cuscuta australis]|uniref:Uncharacterized protein n=1 Tax=Cuscuta australis TaxID=267555 RepID=A0A328DLD0_9ASTE|nr:hypothetical protein DM860_015387 [Cuscuta australis]
MTTSDVPLATGNHSHGKSFRDSFSQPANNFFSSSSDVATQTPSSIRCRFRVRGTEGAVGDASYRDRDYTWTRLGGMDRRRDRRRKQIHHYRYYRRQP